MKSGKLVIENSYYVIARHTMFRGISDVSFFNSEYNNDTLLLAAADKFYEDDLRAWEDAVDRKSSIKNSEDYAIVRVDQVIAKTDWEKIKKLPTDNV